MTQASQARRLNRSRSETHLATAGGGPSLVAPPATNSISWKSMTAREVARHLRLDPSSVRKWPAKGCPIVSQGGRGRGRATRFDLTQVLQWRNRRATCQVGLTPDEALKTIATALLDSLENGHCDIRAGCSHEDAAAVLLLGFQACATAFGMTFTLDSQPAAICALRAHFVQ